MTLSAREKFAYGTGDLASGLLWQSFSLFLMFFYTDVYGLSAAVAGAILFTARAADAVWDLFLGFAVDRTRTRWGRCRPYLLFAPPLLLVAAVATFTVPALEGGAKLAYAYGTYIALMFAYSLVNIPYSSMPALMSSDPAERVRLTSWRLFMAFSAALLVASSMLPLVEWLGAGDKAAGYQKAVLWLSVLAVLLFWFCFAFTRERVATPAARPNIGIELRAMVRSRAWWTLFGAALLQLSAQAMPVTAGMYFLTYVVGHREWASGYFMAAASGMMLGVLISSQLTRRFCKRSVVVYTTAVSALILMALPWVDLSNRIALYAWIFFVSASGAVKAPITWSMVADTADLIELRSGRRVVGLVTSSIAFAHKFAIGLGSGVAGLLLTWFGYQAGVAQTAEAQQGITWLVSLMPACAYLLLAGVYLNYPLNRSSLAKLTAELAASRGQAAQSR